MRRPGVALALWASLSLAAIAQVGGLSFPGPGPRVASGAALSCSYTPVTTGTQSTPYSGATPAASGGAPAYTFSETGSLPGGLSISSSTGVISGTPTASGTFPTIQVKVTDSTSTVANCGSSFTLTIAAPATLALNGHNNSAFTAVGSGTISLTTTAPTMVLVGVSSQTNTATVPSVTSIAGTGLTGCALRKRLNGTAVGVFLQTQGTIGSGTELWSCTAAGNLTAATITVTMSNTVDCGSIVAMGVSGATAFDANVSLPSSTTSTANSLVATTSSGISTTTANAMLVTLFGGYNFSSSETFPLTVGSGYIAVENNLQQSCSLESNAQIQEKIVAVTQSSATLGFATTYNNFYLINDAVH